MTANTRLAVRKDLRKLSRAEMDKLVQAFDAIQKLPATDPDSFYQIAGLHGEPFRGAGYGNPEWWGGYCNHGNILFPTWHRAYVGRIEQALQKQVAGVTLPYWNELDAETTSGPGLPEVLLSERYEFADGRSIRNPLRSYTYQKTIVDRLRTNPDTDYSKPRGSETQRFPFSGLYGDGDVAATQLHNDRMAALGKETTDRYLNDNVKAWLNGPFYVTSNGAVREAGVADQYGRCLAAPNYTVFSNTTSAARWNDDHADEPHLRPAVSLETPHNGIHLAVGGIQIPAEDASSIPGANGDMAENETASFDPIFFFHHAYVDLIFWKWQLLHRQTARLDMPPALAHYPGTNSVDGQGPTPGVQGNVWLSLESPLHPFSRPDDPCRPLTSLDLVDIEKQLGYTYEMPADGLPRPPPLGPQPSACPQLVVSGVNRAAISGSFTVSVWATRPGDGARAQLIGLEPVLSRWHVKGCANCLNHLDVRTHLPLEGWSRDAIENTKFEVLVHTRAAPNGLPALNGQQPELRRLIPPAQA
ncbi:hypothetical protein CDD83_4248 [Cordyceps sp. RAO-2017]|nr:hypothetical protein CDD83_4248 [Cordyceps sp. RAO-2017]